MFRYILMVFIGACCYGVLSTIVKLAYDRGFTVQEVVGSEMLFGAAATWILVAMLRKIRFDWISSLKLLAMGTTVGATALLYYVSLQYIPASLAIVLLFQFTWIGVLIESIWSRRFPKMQEWIALPILALGTLLASGWGSSSTMGQWHIYGVIFGLAAAVSYALFINGSGRVAVETGPLMRSVWMNSGGLILALLIFPPAFLWNGSLFEGLWLWGGLLGVIGILLPTLFFAYGIPHIGGTLASILSSVEMPMAVFMSYVVLQEHVAPLQWLGVIVIFAGIVVSNLKLSVRAKRLS